MAGEFPLARILTSADGTPTSFSLTTVTTMFEVAGNIGDLLTCAPAKKAKITTEAADKRQHRDFLRQGMGDGG